MYSIEHLKAINPAKIVGCSPKHIQSVIEELVATALALAEENKKKDRLLSDEAVTVLKLIRRRDELLSVLEGLTGDIQGLINESTGVVGLHLNGDIATWGELEAGGAFEWLTTLPEAHEAIAKEKGGA